MFKESLYDLSVMARLAYTPFVALLTLLLAYYAICGVEKLPEWFRDVVRIPVAFLAVGIPWFYMYQMNVTYGATKVQANLDIWMLYFSDSAHHHGGTFIYLAALFCRYSAMIALYMAVCHEVVYYTRQFRSSELNVDVLV